METKYVIIMHNLEDHLSDESPLLDSYPKPEVIEHYLKESSYSFAKVEKRYALCNIQQSHIELNSKKEFYEIFYMTEYESQESFGTFDKEEYDNFILTLKDKGLPYII